MARTTQVVSISADPEVLRKIDSAAKRADLSRSEFFVAGATRLAKLQRAEVREPRAIADSAEKPK
jgi:metal-responsive CopG/Arc/MetJ family transcriptional regulator